MGQLLRARARQGPALAGWPTSTRIESLNPEPLNPQAPKPLNPPKPAMVVGCDVLSAVPNFKQTLEPKILQPGFRV